ncbi:hypothetical protein [Myceligenerans xiligouense]|uniref:Circularly permuted ATP-grasp superfamily protein n=1 Tax=Myceligenerans xiligouense TaxID=253184 RepID=A0A3N4Z4A0_9MICO|nr:hypothetical protein [Myceligenerans xiligouense]RPF20748.1 hypothetical protein EDD34_1352 [Myceligenerans xiligouense]
MNDLAALRLENGPTAELLDDPEAARTDTTTAPFDRFRAWFPRPVLSRPTVLTHDESLSLDADLTGLLGLLQSLPERLFGGDLLAFARAVGWRGALLPEVLSLAGGAPVPLGRADLVRSPEGFKTVEFNTSSSLGSFEFGELCRAFLSVPSFARFAERENLGYVDPLAHMADTLLSATGHLPGQRPVIAVTRWVTAGVAVNPSLFVDLMRDLGFRVVVCTIDQLAQRKDGLYVGDLRIDVVHRAFLLQNVLATENALELLAPLARARDAGQVRLFTGLAADLYGAKACLALLSDPRHEDAFTQEERTLVARALPWTRRLADEPTVVDGRTESLVDHVLAHQDDLLLKPGIGNAGRGVMAGWLVSGEEWASAVRSAVSTNDHVVQRRVESAGERFVAPGEPPVAADYLLHWGLFVTAAGLSGGFVKGLPDTPQDVRFLGDGSHVGCIFQQHVDTTRN